MRKYTKPMIVFESFTLSTNIAGDCEWKTNVPNNKDGCGLEMGRHTVFMTGMSGCLTIQITPSYNGNDGKYDEFCYHVFDGTNIFNS